MLMFERKRYKLKLEDCPHCGTVRKNDYYVDEWSIAQNKLPICGGCFIGRLKYTIEDIVIIKYGEKDE